MTDTIERQPVRVARDVAAKVGQGSDWKPNYRRSQPEWNGTTPTTGNERKPIVGKPEPPVQPRAKVTVHEEREFTFSSGEIVRRCPVDFCDWGKKTAKGFRKTHSNGETFAPTFEDDIPTVVVGEDGEQLVEVSEDDPRELSVEDDLTAAANATVEFALEQEDETDAGEETGTPTESEENPDGE